MHEGTAPASCCASSLNDAADMVKDLRLPHPINSNISMHIHAYDVARYGKVSHGMTILYNLHSSRSQSFEFVQLYFGLLHTWGPWRPSLICEDSNVPGSLRNSKDDPLGGATYAKTPTQLPQPREM